MSKAAAGSVATPMPVVRGDAGVSATAAAAAVEVPMPASGEMSA